MSNLTINERFTLDADAEVVWRYLIDPQRIIRCLPGAEFISQEDELNFTGAVKVKVGAVTVAYKGTAVFEEIDHEARFVRIVGRGREKTGSGTVTMTMESRVRATDSGGAEVTVDAQVKLAGKIVRFGRGMIETISSEIFREFTVRLADVIAQEQASTDPPRDDHSNEEAGGSGPAESIPESSADSAATGSPATSSTAHDGDDDNAIALIPLLWRVFTRRVRSWFGKD